MKKIWNESWSLGCLKICEYCPSLRSSASSFLYSGYMKWIHFLAHEVSHGHVTFWEGFDSSCLALQTLLPIPSQCPPEMVAGCGKAEKAQICSGLECSTPGEQLPRKTAGLRLWTAGNKPPLPEVKDILAPFGSPAQVRPSWDTVQSVWSVWLTLHWRAKEKSCPVSLMVKLCEILEGSETGFISQTQLVSSLQTWPWHLHFWVSTACVLIILSNSSSEQLGPFCSTTPY